MDVGFIVEVTDVLCVLQVWVCDDWGDVFVVDVVVLSSWFLDAMVGYIVFGSHIDCGRTIEYVSGVMFGVSLSRALVFNGKRSIKGI